MYGHGSPASGLLSVLLQAAQCLAWRNGITTWQYGELLVARMRRCVVVRTHPVSTSMLSEIHSRVFLKRIQHRASGRIVALSYSNAIRAKSLSQCHVLRKFQHGFESLHVARLSAAATMITSYTIIRCSSCRRVRVAVPQANGIARQSAPTADG